VDGTTKSYQSTNPTAASPTWTSSGTLPESGGLSISCPSLTACAVGTTGGYGVLGVINTSTPGSTTWTQNSQGSSKFTGTSCSSASFCLTTEDSGTDKYKYTTNTTNTTKWAESSNFSEVTVTGLATSPDFYAVSCTPGTTATSGLCIMTPSTSVTGTIYYSTTPGTASSWTAESLDSGNAIEGVSCYSSSACVIVDNDGNSLYSTTPTSAASWTKTDIDSTRKLVAVSCDTTASGPSSSLCVTVDASGYAVASTSAGASWGSPVDIDGSTALTAVSCTDAYCVAAGGGSVASYTNPSAAPTDATLPGISGTDTDGSTLTASEGTWNNSPTSFAYQWEDCTTSGETSCANISGATSSTYVLQTTDISSYVAVKVTATNSQGSASATSNATSQIEAAKPVNSVVPSVSGIAKQGEVLTTTNGTWSGDPAPTYTYQWQRCTSSSGGGTCTNISGATSTTYTLASGDVGDYMVAVVTASNTGHLGGAEASASSATTSQVATAVPTVTTAPFLTGMPVTGQTLSATQGTWGNSPTSYSYAWQDCNNAGASCTNISGATSSTYTVQASDQGDAIQAVVTGTNSFGSATATSNLTAEANPAPTATSIDGTGADGTLTIATTGITQSGGSNYSCTEDFTACNVKATYTLKRDINSASITVKSGVTVNTNGYIIYATGTATIESGAVLEDNGVAAVGFNEEACTLGPSCTEAGATGLSGATLAGSGSGATGGGGSPVPNLCGTGNSCPQPGGAGSGVTGIGGAGGLGGTGSGSAGGAGGTVTAPSSGGNPPSIYANLTYLATDSGGSGGGGGSTASSSVSAAGGGGSGGGIVEIQAPTIANSGSIQAKGGAGGGAYGSTNAGGGGGGGGGAIYLIYTTLTGSGTTSAAGGAAGTSKGNSGGYNGAAGAAGVVEDIQAAPPTSTVAPALTGLPVVGSVLSTGNGSWTNGPTSYSYQWQDCNNAGSSCANISGATGSTYTVQSTDLGSAIQAVVTATDTFGSTSAASNLTAEVDPTPSTSNVYGNGVDGTITLATSGITQSGGSNYSCSEDFVSCTAGSTYKLRRDINSASFNIESGVTLDTDGYIVYATGTLTIASGATVYAAGEAGDGYTVGTAGGSGWPSGSLAGSASGGTAGLCGVGQTCPINGGAGGATNPGIGGAGGIGGSGIGSAGAGGSVTAPSSGGNPPSSVAHLTYLATDAGGSGGGGGSSGGTSNSADAGGAGGGGGGNIEIQADNLTNSGTITAAGGAGGTANSSYSTGGGGGGGGGDIYLIYTSLSGSGTTNVTGGALGSGGGGNAKGNAGNVEQLVVPPPGNEALPSLVGTASDGQTLSTTNGAWNPEASSYAYQWQRCNSAGASCANISGATEATYTLTDTDVSNTVRAQVTATTSAGSGVADSGVSAEVSATTPSNSVSPVVSGTATAGQILSTTQGTWTAHPAPTYAYQWERCNTSGESCSNISGATGTSYTLVSSDVGHTIVATVKASNATYYGGSTVSAASTHTAEVSAVPPSNSVAPIVSGTDNDGQALTGTQGTWSGIPSPTYSYQWERCNTSGTSCTAISGATSSTYTLTDSDVGHRIVLSVTASNSSAYGGGEATTSSTATSTVQAVAPSNSVAPAVSPSSNLEDGEQLSATTGTWSGKPTPTYTYQWEDCSSSDESCTNISGSTSSKYTLTDTDVGSTIAVVVTATNASYTGGSAVSATSNYTTVVPSLVNDSAPVVSGTDTDSSTLSTTNGSWSGPAPSYSYQWEDCSTSGKSCTIISGATGSTYALADADVGHTVRSTVTATNSGGSLSSSSTVTPTIEAIPPANTTPPSVSGTTQDGHTLTVAHGTWSGAPAPTYTYQWEDCNTSGHECANISGAGNSNTYALRTSDIGYTVEVVVTASNSSYTGGASASATSAHTATVEAEPPTNTEAPSVSGTAKDGNVLTAAHGTWSGDPVPAYSYQWEDCNTSGGSCSNISGATGTTYTLGDSDVGSTVRVVVTASNAGYAGGAAASASSSHTATVEAIPPSDNTAPSISGTDQDGATLTAAHGSWSGAPAPTYSYQWQDCSSSGTGCSNISGATSQAYTLADSDIGHKLVVVVTASNASYVGGGEASASSAPTSEPISASNLVNTEAPVVTGTDKDGSTLSTSNGTWTGVPAPTYTYQWERCNTSGAECAAIPGATSTTYTLTDSDVGHKITSVVTATNANGPVSASSSATAVINAVAPANTEAPSISGTDKDGQALTAAHGTWSGAPAPTYSYQWQDCNGSGASCANISGATSSSYTLADSDIGHTIVVVVTASNASYTGGGSASAASAATSSVTATPAANTVAPTISGTTKDSEALTASTGTWSGAPVPAYSYQWQRCNSSGAGCSSISGATSTSYTLTEADIGHKLVVVVTGTNASYTGGGEAQATSQPSSLVTALAPANTAAPAISGTAQDGATLTTTNGTWTGAPSPTYAYQWQDCGTSGESCANISGATEGSYTLADSDIGHTIVVVVTASNSSYTGGGTASAASGHTATVVASGVVNTKAPSISGTTEDGDALTASTGTWTGHPTPTFTYQWQRCNTSGEACSNISGATEGSYALTEADMGHTIVVVVTGTNSSGSTPASSAATSVVTAAPPASTSAPTVSGTTKDSDTLTTTTGTWSGAPAPTYSYQWQRCNTSGASCAMIVGANATTYTLGDADIDHTIRSIVTANNSSYAGGAEVAASSLPTATVTALPPTNTEAPSVSGTDEDSYTLTATNGAWTAAPAPSYTYQWQDCNAKGEACTNISGATASTYMLTDTDVGHTVRIGVTASNAVYTGGGSATAYSAPSGEVTASGLTNTQVPVISGNTVDGEVLTTTTGTWVGSPAPSYAYQWERCNSSGTGCADIPGATSSAYTLTDSDVGSTLISVVTATNPSGSAQASSAHTAVVTASVSSSSQAPVISGTAKDSDTLTTTSGTWTGHPTPTYAYQWERCNSSGTGCATLSGATATTYTLTDADIDHTIRSEVTASNGEEATASSAPTAVVTALAPSNTQAPSVSGTDEDTYTLTATNGTWSGAPTPTYAYQWQRCSASGESCSNISGATSATYVLADGDVGHTVRIGVTASNSSYTGGGSATAYSTPSSEVTASNLANTEAPIISGTDTDGATLSTTTGVWTGSPAPTYTYQWQRCNASGEDCANISGATSSTHALTDSDVGSTLVSVVTATNPSGSAQASSAPTSVIKASSLVNTEAPTISGTDKDGSTLTTSSGVWTGSPAPTFAYQWERCSASGESCASISGATSTTYTLTDSDVGHTIVSVVTATNPSGSVPASSQPTSVIDAVPPTNTEAPSVSGTAKDGDVLTAARGVWTGKPTPTYSYQWERCSTSGEGCISISGATGSTYTLTDSDVGHTAVVAVTASNASYTGGGEATASSQPTATIDATPPVNTQAPSIAGTGKDGDMLTASPGTWSGAPAPTYTYQWQRCNSSGAECASISGATATTYTLTNSDVGHDVEVTVTASNASYPGGGEATASSQPTSVIDAVPPTSTEAPSINGTAQDGSTLTASPGTWSGAPTPTYAYQWERCSATGEGCTDISGATSSTYVLTDSDVGHALVVAVTASNSSYTGGGEATASSPATAEVSAKQPANTSLPTISGTAQDGDVLTGTTGAWTGAPAPTYAYQWQDCSTSGESCVSISGATSSTYTLTGTDVGSTIRLAITASNASYHGGGEATATSAKTATVVAAGPADTQAPYITGTTQDGSILMANVGTWTGTQPITYSYAWETCNASGGSCAPNGVTTSTYDLGHSDVDTTLRVQVTATNSSGSSSATSEATSVIDALPPVNTVLPVISGKAEDRLALTVSTGTWSGTPPISYAYQWYRGGASSCSASDTAISGATSASYTATFFDVGDELCVTVTASNSSLPGGSSAVALAEPTEDVSGSTQIRITNGVYATSVDNTRHIVAVASGSTGEDLVSDIQPIDQSTQTYQVDAAPAGSGVLRTGMKLDVHATDPAEQEYEIVVASSGNCEDYPYGCTSGPVGYTPPYSETDVRGAVDSGTLSLTPAAYESWTSHLSSAGDQIASYSDPIDTNDNRGSGQGWHETVTSTSYVGQSTAGTTPTSGPPPNAPGDSGDQGLSSGDNLASSGTPFAFGVSGTHLDSVIESVATADSSGSTDTNPEDPLDTPVEVPQSGTAPTPDEFYDAAYGTGRGNFTLTPDVAVVVPANAYDGYYSSVVTLAIVSGP
jgi:hypothetical protein